MKGKSKKEKGKSEEVVGVKLNWGQHRTRVRQPANQTSPSAKGGADTPVRGRAQISLKEIGYITLTVSVGLALIRIGILSDGELRLLAAFGGGVVGASLLVVLASLANGLIFDNDSGRNAVRYGVVVLMFIVAIGMSAFSSIILGFR